MFAASVLLLLCAGAAAIQLPSLRDHLEAARSELTSGQQALRDGDVTRARGQVSAADEDARTALATTEGLSWRLVRRVPGLGLPFRELAATSEVARLTTSQVATPLVRAAFAPPQWRGRIDTAPLVRAQEPLRRAEEALGSARQRLSAAPASHLGPLEAARRSLSISLTRLAGTVHEASVAADVLPPLVGSDRPRRYFLAIQNPAEQRATGGLIGVYGIVRADRGTLTLEHVGSDRELKDPGKPVIDLGAEFERRYGRFGATSTWRGANVTPDVPTAGRILSALWSNSTGQQLDGVIFVDPQALALVLRATGPVVLSDGTRLTAANAADVLLREVYQRFPRSADEARKQYLQQAARQVFARLHRPGIKPRVLLTQAGRAIGTGHLRVWTADGPAESRLRTSVAGGALPRTSPYLRVVTQDAGGSKLDVYLRQMVAYDAHRTGEAADLGAGPQPEEAGTVRVTLTNTAPRTGLPEYVTLRVDDPDGRPRPLGQLKSWVSVYVGVRATLDSATLDGKPLLLSSDTDQGLAVFSTFVSIDPGATATLVLKVHQPIGPAHG